VVGVTPGRTTFWQTKHVFHARHALRPQPAYQQGTGAAPRPWSKYSEGASAHDRAQPKEEAPAKKSVREEKKKRKLRHGGEPAGMLTLRAALACKRGGQLSCIPVTKGMIGAAVHVLLGMLHVQ